MISKTFFAAGLLTIFANAAHANNWEWAFTPHLWASDITADVSINDEPVIGADVSFSDVLDSLEFAAQLHFEGRRGKGGFLFDVTFMNLGDTRTGVAHPPLSGDTTVRADLKQTLVEAGGFYRLSEEARGLDILFGVRVIDYEMDLDITLPHRFHCPRVLPRPGLSRMVSQAYVIKRHSESAGPSGFVVT
jgi:hypothetical protein